jgi:hypothetical protein
VLAYAEWFAKHTFSESSTSVAHTTSDGTARRPSIHPTDATDWLKSVDIIQDNALTVNPIGAGNLQYPRCKDNLATSGVLLNISALVQCRSRGA